MPESLGARLQRLREAAGLSQSELAEAAKVSIGSLRNWEQDRRMLALDAAGRVAAALGVSLDDLADSPPAPGRPRKALAEAEDKPAKKKGKGKK